MRTAFTILSKLRNSYTMGYPPVRGDNKASGLSYVKVDNHVVHLKFSEPRNVEYNEVFFC